MFELSILEHFEEATEKAMQTGQTGYLSWVAASYCPNGMPLNGTLKTLTKLRSRVNDRDEGLRGNPWEDANRALNKAISAVKSSMDKKAKVNGIGPPIHTS